MPWGVNPMPPRPLSTVRALTTDCKALLDGCHAGIGCPIESHTMRDRYRARLPWPWPSRDPVASLSLAFLTKEHEIGFANAPTAASRPRSPSLDAITALRAPLGHPSRSLHAMAELRL